jgi:hypothetical protein
VIALSKSAFFADDKASVFHWNAMYRFVLTICVVLAVLTSTASAEFVLAPAAEDGHDVILCSNAEDLVANNSAFRALENFNLTELVGLQSPWEIAGWTNLAYYNKNIPLSFAYDDLGSFDDIPDRINLAQQWFYLTRRTDGSDGWDFGGRIDLMYGTDGQKNQAYGNPGADVRGRGRFDASLDHGIYGWALPQTYAEVAYQDFTTKVGHFITPLGYERTQARDNFFHSHSFTSFDSEPFTHTGFLTTYSGFEQYKIYAGWSAGWDTGFDSFNGGSNLISGVEFKLHDSVTFTYLNTYGNFGWRGVGSNNSYSHTCVLKAELTDKLQYIAESDLLTTENNVANSANDVGLVQYLIYKMDDLISFGGRAEWWKSNGASYNEVTLGVNIHLLENLILRPEIRQDWIPAQDFSQGVFAIDAVYDY